MSSKRTLMHLKDVGKDYKNGPSVVKAVHHASLTLEPREFVLLQGMSGSGKTTLLSIMGCLMKPTYGRVEICGTDVTELSESYLPKMRLNHIGFIFQSFNLFPALTGLQNVTLALQLKGYGWRERRREGMRLLDRVGLTKEMHRKPSEMSGGQRQRVSIARALAGKSDVILADEPTAALDTATGIEIMTLMQEMTQDGERAAFIVTHDTRLERFATRVDRITDGVLTVGAHRTPAPAAKPEPSPAEPQLLQNP
jgi:putative ABC transport system ATP-binding protein